MIYQESVGLMIIYCGNPDLSQISLATIPKV